VDFLALTRNRGYITPEGNYYEWFLAKHFSCNRGLFSVKKLMLCLKIYPFLLEQEGKTTKGVVGVVRRNS
jgi:hypothetical protein